MRGAPFSSFLFFFFLPVVVGKLLRINEWYGLTLPPKSSVSLQLSLFYSCDRSTIVVKTGKDLTSRLVLYFDGDNLEQADVDSAKMAAFPQTQKVVGGCREKERKSVSLNVTSTPGFFELRVEGQVFRRAKAKKRGNFLQIGLSQETSCCIIKAVLLTDSEDVTVAPMETSTTMTPSSRPTTTVFDAPYPIQQVTRRVKSAAATTPSHDYKLTSWTDVVNREWSNAFLICAGTTCALMTALIIFGLVSWAYLLTKPSDAAPLYRVDTPVSVF